MGAWGPGSFENDAAMDWAGSVQSVDDVRKPFERLKRDTDAYDRAGELIVDADFACELLVAAECVAFMLGRKSRDFPDDLAQRLGGSGEPDNLLFHQARNGMLHVLRNSELADLWQEAASEGGFNEWLIEMTGLIDRLNSDVAVDNLIEWFEPSVEEIGDPADIVGTCAFCDGPIERQHLWGMSVHNPFDGTGVGKKSFWLHLPCLNARMHHKHAVADFKFDPANMPDLDQL